MNRGRIVICSGFVALVAAVLLTARTEAQPNTVQQIVPGVWFREGDIKKEGHCNNIIIEMKDYLIVVDANFPSGARLAAADAKKVSNKPVKYVFDTHHHGDHAYGNSVWTAMGATTLAYSGVAQEMKRYEPKRWKETNRKDVTELHQNSVEPPKQTFDKTPFVLDDGTRRVEFHFFGWAHTRGDGFVYLPKEQVLATGDAIVNGAYNFMGDGNIANWPNVAENAGKRSIRHVLPAHGRPGGREIITGQGRFMKEIYAGVQSLIKQGKSVDDLQKMGMAKTLEASLRFSPEAKNWVGDGLAGQAVATYEEITQKKPHGEIDGGK
ncbi:MAG TPA: MBL fold metallo-hydrolase [Bryobacteraceae bacterium]|nr:MBL fold metallo-hydrolase [Bryobacteraceae bacterium]